MCAGFCHAIVSLLANTERIGALRDSKARSKERQLVSALECGAMQTHAMEPTVGSV